MEAVSRSPCPHGLPRDKCQICQVLEPTAVPAGRRASMGRAGLGGNLAVVAIAAVVGFVVLGWVAAAFFAVLRIVELLAVAAVAGWVGWKVGVQQGKRRR
jgi:hypothetical protein